MSNGKGTVRCSSHDRDENTYGIAKLENKNNCMGTDEAKEGDYNGIGQLTKSVRGSKSL